MRSGNSDYDLLPNPRICVIQSLSLSHVQYGNFPKLKSASRIPGRSGAICHEGPKSGSGAGTGGGCGSITPLAQNRHFTLFTQSLYSLSHALCIKTHNVTLLIIKERLIGPGRRKFVINRKWVRKLEPSGKTGKCVLIAMFSINN